MKRLFTVPLIVLLFASIAAAQGGIPAGNDCECCQSGPLFPKLQAMLAVHRTQAQFSSYGSCQKGCCQKGCVQKGCVQKGCVQKGCVQKGCVQKGCVQKGCVQKTCAPKCVQKPCVQKFAPKGCCQKSVCQKSCSVKGGCGKPRGLLMAFGLFKRGGNGKGCCPTTYSSACCGASGSPHGTVDQEIPTPTLNGRADPFQDDPNPLRTTSYGRYR